MTTDEARLFENEIVTQRLLLRAPRQRDASEFFAYASGGKVGPMAGWSPHRTRLQTRSIISGFRAGGNVLAITLRDSGHMIGTVGLHTDDHRPGVGARMLGYALDPKFWGQGYALEASQAVLKHGFETNMLRLISAYCFPENTRSSALLERLGMHSEGCLRRSYVLYDGSIHDLLCYSMTIEEYIAR